MGIASGYSSTTISPFEVLIVAFFTSPSSPSTIFSPLFLPTAVCSLSDCSPSEPLYAIPKPIAKETKINKIPATIKYFLVLGSSILSLGLSLILDLLLTLTCQLTPLI